MTEAEWLVCSDPLEMFNADVFKGSFRKVGLFSVAGSHLAWDQLDDAWRARVDQLERRAESEPVWMWEDERGTLSLADPTVLALHYVLDSLLECHHQADVIRDIFGNPFQPITWHPSWRTSTVVTIAKTMYDSRDFSPMPLLADALQDAGCENEDILNHCRSGGPHVRGCWVVDLVLGKE